MDELIKSLFNAPVLKLMRLEEKSLVAHPFEGDDLQSLLQENLNISKTSEDFSKMYSMSCTVILL